MDSAVQQLYIYISLEREIRDEIFISFHMMILIFCNNPNPRRQKFEKKFCNE
jgi:hypothetical protein